MNLLFAALLGFVLVPVVQDTEQPVKSPAQVILEISHLRVTHDQCQTKLLDAYKPYRNKLKDKSASAVTASCTPESLTTSLESLVTTTIGESQLAATVKFLRSRAGKNISTALVKRAKSKHKLRMITPDTQRVLIAKNAEKESQAKVEALLAKIQVSDDDLLEICKVAGEPFFEALYNGKLEKELVAVSDEVIASCVAACKAQM